MEITHSHSEFALKFPCFICTACAINMYAPYKPLLNENVNVKSIHWLFRQIFISLYLTKIAL